MPGKETRRYWGNVQIVGLAKYLSHDRFVDRASSLETIHHLISRISNIDGRIIYEIYPMIVERTTSNLTAERRAD